MHTPFNLKASIPLVLGLALFAETAVSQGPPGPPSRPTTSPYLNLLRNNQRNNFALDYYRLVRPEQEWRNYTSRLNQRLSQVESSIGQRSLLPDGSVSDMRTTGHPTSFLNTGGYFPQSPR